MRNTESLYALLQSVQRGGGFNIPVDSVKNINDIMHIGLSNPKRIAKMTLQTYNKIKDYLVVQT